MRLPSLRSIALAAMVFGCAPQPERLPPPEGSATLHLLATPSHIPADGASAVLLTVRATDAHGQPIQGQAVTLEANGSGNRFTPAPGKGSTNRSGVFTATLVSTQPGTKTVTATADIGTASASATFVDVTPCKGTPLYGAAVPAKTQSTGASTLAFGDFNGDGNVDLATTAITILLGNGDGTFRASGIYTVGGWAESGANSLVAGDFNGDGNLDLVTANLDRTVSILLGNGDGTFASAVNIGGGVGLRAGIVRAEDFNGDGFLDLAVTEDESVDIWLGKGDGTFNKVVPYSVGDWAYSLAVGDLNGDGHPDLVVGNDLVLGEVYVLLGNGDGTFSAAVPYLAGDGRVAVAVGDFNEDGRLDVAATRDASVSILLGNGDGTLAAPVDYAANVAAAGSPTLLAADLNGDGHLDLAMTGSNSATTVGVLLGNGDGTFGSASISIPSAPTFVDVSDFNGDGHLDLAFCSGSGDSVGIRLYSECGPAATPLTPLPPTEGTLTGVVTLAGSPAAGTPVLIEGGPLGGSKTVVTDPTGTYQGILPAGQYSVTCSLNQGSAQTASLLVVAGQSTKHNFAF